MSADDEGNSATQDKERAQEVWTGLRVGEPCPGKNQSRMGSSGQGIWTNGKELDSLGKEGW